MQALNESSSIEEVLQYIVACYGAEIYQDKQRLSNLIADLYRGEEKKKRVYRRAILDDSLSVKVHNLSLIPLSQRKAYYQPIVSKIIFRSKNIVRPISQLVEKQMNYS